MTDRKFWDRNPSCLIFSEGESMYGTIKPYDRLLVKPYSSCENVREGDVIAFLPPGETKIMVHRIVRIDIEGRIWARGDNNYTNDPWPLVRDNIIGRITYAYRGKNKLRIYGNLAGRWQGFFTRLLKYIFRYTRSLLILLHCLTAIRRLVSTFISFFIRVRPFTISASDFELHILLGKEVIGRYIARNSKWYIHRQYLTLIDIEQLLNSCKIFESRTSKVNLKITTSVQHYNKSCNV